MQYICHFMMAKQLVTKNSVCMGFFLFRFCSLYGLWSRTNFFKHGWTQIWTDNSCDWKCLYCHGAQLPLLDGEIPMYYIDIRFSEWLDDWTCMWECLNTDKGQGYKSLKQHRLKLHEYYKNTWENIRLLQVLWELKSMAEEDSYGQTTHVTGRCLSAPLF